MAEGRGVGSDMTPSGAGEDTIAAISTPLGEGGIGVVRVSGPGAVAIAGRLFRPSRQAAKGRAESFRLRHGRVVTDEGEVIDEALLAVMRRPRSYTREDVVEFQCHGGPLVVRRVLDAVLSAGARLAVPGEFTKRAFLNGRLDLAEAEAVMAVIRARTEASLRAAMEGLGGRLSARVRALQDQLVRAIAQVEAGVDFPEDEIDESPFGPLRGECEGLRSSLAELLASAHTGKILRHGLKVVLAGRPNVGKSSLLNALLREGRAIVTPIPGTTRDAIEETLDLRGVPVRLVDTAGLRETTDPVESLGVERSVGWLKSADVALTIIDATQGLNEQDRRLLTEVREKAVVVANKVDLLEGARLPVRLSEELGRLTGGRPVLAVSAVTGQGLAALEDELLRFVFSGGAEAPEEALVSSARVEEALRRGLAALDQAVATLGQGLPEDLAVVDLREAWAALGEITGDTVSEEILDRLFADFCVGK
ncbi:MAG: tRNA uridine-5-carboxymethylaminomethyl(34) synthesis GTPase MnmE [Bacillota bacterium]